ncbi:MAG TPA: hypothetical protein VJ508_14115, partial [Saprospiraceae bacterium]|nr:hypothetical protein [Saprospiraceae bacterium]
FRVFTDNEATIMNLVVKSSDISRPMISVFLAPNEDCSILVPIGLTSTNLGCIQGSNGRCEAIGTAVGSNSVYYIAITSWGGEEGSFRLCLNTISVSYACVAQRDIEILDRSDGGPLTGPYNPGETVTVSFNVNSYTAAGNGCQWFQGLVPVFGNGWDPNSFDGNGQPLNTTLNGNPISMPENGNYGTATWEWFTDVDYHYANSNLQVGDLDGNGTVDMCNLLYEPDCPDLGGIQAGCCGPCWGSPLGTILPPGWFAYGVNGTCPTPGPPIRVDWGDGNTCGGGMGPWQFQFELKIRDFPDCDTDPTTKDLSLGFFTFADGETGSWTGAASACSVDQPAFLRLPLTCRLETNLGTVTLPDQCSGNAVSFELYQPGVSYWDWTVYPDWFVEDTVFSGDNGQIVYSHPHYTGNSVGTITYTFTGHQDNTDDVFIKYLTYRVVPPIEVDLKDRVTICERRSDSLILFPEVLKGGEPPYSFLWNPVGETSNPLILYPPFHETYIRL